MAKQKLISDIRYFESEIPNVDGTNPNYLGTLIEKPVSGIHSIGQRIALKLRELGFATVDFDHVYINLTSACGLDAIAIAQRNYRGLLKRIRYYDVGSDFAAINQLPPLKRDEWFADMTFRVLRLIASDNSVQMTMIDRVEDLHRKMGEELPIVRKSKATKSYEIVVSFHVATHPKKSSAFIRYQNKKTGESRCGKFLELSVYDDIFSLVGSIALKKGEIVLTPNSSVRADVWTEEYNTPIVIPLESLEIV